MALLDVQNLRTYFMPRRRPFGPRPEPIRAVDDVSFSVEAGTTVGLVGESGSGKSTLAKTVIKLVPATGGRVVFRGQEVLGLPEREFRPLRRGIQMIFQDPAGALDPRMTVAEILAEPMEIHLSLSRAERRARAAGLLERVGLETSGLDRFPHQFSGGQKQRIGIARALAVEPDLLICDEPVSALDVSVQAQIINLLQDLQEEFHLAYLFIGHDLAVIEHLSDHVLVMKDGRLVESAPADQIYRNPQHPYTKELLDAAA